MCRQVDLTLLEHLPGTSLEGLRRVDDLLARRAHLAHLSLPVLPQTEADFVQWLLREHGRFFGDVGLPFAGVLRSGPGVFGRSGTKHEREGSHPEDIVAHLHGVFRKFLTASKDGSETPRVMAIFLQAFFEVHPFADGNGRIGRLFVAAYASQCGYQYQHARGHRADEYEKALEDAHKWCARNSAARSCPPVGADERTRDGLGLLIKYLRDRLVSRDLDDSTEAPPDEPT